MNHLQIENRKGKLKLNDGVHKDSADQLIDQLEKLYGPSAVAAKMVIGEAVCVADDALESVEVEINSPGGSVFEGNRIYNALRGMSARGVEITTTVNGLAASMGSVILMAGDKRQMTQGSRIMIHEASTIAWGDARAMRKNAELLEGISAEIAGIYADRTGGDADKIRNLMFAETWMTADEAKENGFVHAVIKDGKAKAEFDTKGKAESMNLINRLTNPSADEAQERIVALESQISGHADIVAEYENKLSIAESALQEATTALSLIKGNFDEVSAKLDAAEKLTNEQAEKIAELEEANKATAEKVSEKASELLAQTGHPSPVALADEADGSGPTDHLKILASLTGSERTEYYAQHGKEIRKQLTKK